MKQAQHNNCEKYCQAVIPHNDYDSYLCVCVHICMYVWGMSFLPLQHDCHMFVE
jgi:hypothetical protein